MRGQVLGVNLQTGEGQVSGDDGRRYTFRPADWAHRGEPSVGATVDFETEDRRAINIFPLPTASGVGAGAIQLAHPAKAPAPPRSDRSRWIAALLAFLFGPLGVHRFYTGRKKTGIAMLVLSLTFFGLAITVPWAIVDLVRYVTMGAREFDERHPPLPSRQ